MGETGDDDFEDLTVEVENTRLTKVASSFEGIPKILVYEFRNKKDADVKQDQRSTGPPRVSVIQLVNQSTRGSSWVTTGSSRVTLGSSMVTLGSSWVTLGSSWVT